MIRHGNSITQISTSTSTKYQVEDYIRGKLFLKTIETKRVPILAAKSGICFLRLDIAGKTRYKCIFAK
jgi:hypothetical protein